MALQEITLRLANRPGTLERVARRLAEERVNVAAISVDSVGRLGNVRLVVNDPARAIRSLRKAGYEVETHELLAVHLEDRAGSFLKVLEVLARAEVNIRSVVILVAREGTQTLVALSVDDVASAKRTLRAEGFLSSGAERLVTNADLVSASPAIPSESVGMLL
jgi:hypothetical protein